MDIDNIPKPISDGLKGLVYPDDEQVTDVLCRKRSLNSSLGIENPSRILAEGFRRGNEFLYIVVGVAGSRIGVCLNLLQTVICAARGGRKR